MRGLSDLSPVTHLEGVKSQDLNLRGARCRVQAPSRAPAASSKSGPCSSRRRPSLPPPSPRPAPAQPPPGPPSCPTLVPAGPAGPAAHHGLLELVGLDAAHEEGLAGAQRAHQQLQGPLELAAECGRALPGLGALGDGPGVGGAGRALSPPGREAAGRALVRAQGRAAGPGKRRWGLPVTRRVWAGA